MYIEQTDSTNNLMLRVLRGEEPQYAACLEEVVPVLYTGYQTAGRGQTGNGWESEREKNLLFTYLLRDPEVAVTEQFVLNMIASVALHSAVSSLLTGEEQQRLTIKWPNDLYYGDEKLAGILVENMLSGHTVRHSIAGIGLNLNQQQWIGNAPNPISVAMVTGKAYDKHEVMEIFMQSLHKTLGLSRDALRGYYMQHLYRREGWHPYVERAVSTAPTMIADAGTNGQFLAHIADITAQGELVLTDKQGCTRTYHFKQVRYVIH